MSISVRDIAWLAGLLEGEGSFFNIKKQFAPRVALGMTDADVVRKAAALIGSPSVYLTPRSLKNPKHKDQHWFMLTGHTAAGVMMTIYPFMGERRRSKIREVLARWKQTPYGRRSKGQAVINCKHVQRSHYAHGLCRSCYVRRQERGEYRVA